MMKLTKVSYIIRTAYYSDLFLFMLLYKFKSLQNLDHVLDILVLNRLYCAHFEDLNDPMEGLFKTILPLGSLGELLSKGLDRPPVIQNIENLVHEDSISNRVCSLSKTVKDMRLWSYYADGHRGVAIEIEFNSQIMRYVPEVKYVRSIPSIDGLSSPKYSSDILRYKMENLNYEQECRVISSGEYLALQVNQIRKIYLGVRVSQEHKDLLKNIVPKNIEIVGTRINDDPIEIRPST